MSVTVKTTNPASLLQSIKKAIDEKAIKTWTYDNDGDFSHSPEQWNYKAWLRPKIQNDRIIFNVITPQNSVMYRSTYAVLHGRFIEMMLTHFDDKFETATASALPTSGDVVKAE